MLLSASTLALVYCVLLYITICVVKLDTVQKQFGKKKTIHSLATLSGTPVVMPLNTKLKASNDIPASPSMYLIRWPLYAFVICTGAW